VFPLYRPPPCDHFVCQKNRATAVSRLKQSRLSSPIRSRRTTLAPWCCTTLHLGRRSTRAPPRWLYPQAELPPRCTPSPLSAADQGEHNRDLLIIAMSQGQSSSKTMDIALVEDSPAGSDGGAAGRPVLRRRRLTIYSLSSILWPPVEIGRGVPFHSD
jgi:hypothetical protein